MVRCCEEKKWVRLSVSLFLSCLLNIIFIEYSSYSYFPFVKIWTNCTWYLHTLWTCPYLIPTWMIMNTKIKTVCYLLHSTMACPLLSSCWVWKRCVRFSVRFRDDRRLGLGWLLTVLAVKTFHGTRGNRREFHFPQRTGRHDGRPDENRSPFWAHIWKQVAILGAHMKTGRHFGRTYENRSPLWADGWEQVAIIGASVRTSRHYGHTGAGRSLDWPTFIYRVDRQPWPQWDLLQYR